MKVIKALLPVVAIVLFEYFTDWRNHLVDREYILLMLIQYGSFFIMITFFIFQTKRFFFRNIVVTSLILFTLPHIMLAVFNKYYHLTGDNDLFRDLYQGFYALYVNFDLKMIGTFVLLGSFVLFAIKERSKKALGFSILAIAVFTYQYHWYEYPLMNDPYEEIVFAFKRSQMTSFRYALTYLLLLNLPVFFGFLSLQYSQKKT